MNPSTTQARVMVDALLACGVRDAVLSPGSRSAPLAFALAAAERAGRLRLHVRIDERSAGYLALGMAKASGRPVPVAVTSGTAVANLFPAVVEASWSGVPLLVLSADRPPALRGVGASQTIDQLKIFGDNVRHFVDVAPALAGGEDGYWRSVIGRATAAASDPADPGPVHVNVPFAEPLVPDVGPVETALNGRRSAPLIAPLGPLPEVPLRDVLAAMGLPDVPVRGLVVVGDVPDVGWQGRERVARLAEAAGWPILAESSAGMHGAATWLPSGSLVAGCPEWVSRHEPEIVISVGRVGLARSVLGILGGAEHHLVIDRGSRWADPVRSAGAALIGAMPALPTAAGDSGRMETPWLAAWRSAAALAARVVDAGLDDLEVLTGLHVAREVWRSLPDDGLLFAAASWPIRQIETTARSRTGLRVLANRGANGIDGLVSTAWGASVAHQADGGGPCLALLGDLAFLHDSNGLLAPVVEQRPSLTVVVTDNDGGGIFSQLEQSAPQYADDFERLFGTPHGLQLVGRARLSAVPARAVDRLDRLASALHERPPGVSVLVAEVADRAAEASLMARLQRQVADALTGG